MANKEKIMERLISDFDLLTQKGYQVIGVFLQGSQNYGLDYEGSDVDTKAIVVPTIRQLALNEKPISYTYVHPNNEHIDVKDVRVMHTCFKKQNINMLEILFTEYKYINPLYESIYNDVIEKRELIAHRNMKDAVHCIVGMIKEKHHALEHPYPVTKEEIAKYGYAAKQLHHMFRCKDFLLQYINGTSFEECLFPNDPSMLLDLKTKHDATLEQARIMADICEMHAVEIQKAFENESVETHQAEVDRILNDALVLAVERAASINLENVLVASNTHPDMSKRCNCKVRHENGNCLPHGGFCTSVGDNVCEAIRQAYDSGYTDGYRDSFVADLHRSTT